MEIQLKTSDENGKPPIFWPSNILFLIVKLKTIKWLLI